MEPYEARQGLAKAVDAYVSHANTHGCADDVGSCETAQDRVADVSTWQGHVQNNLEVYRLKTGTEGDGDGQG